MAIKGKEISSQLKPVRKSYVTRLHQLVANCQLKHMQPNACTNKAFSNISTRFDPYLGWYKIYEQQHHPKQELNLVDVLENALFVHALD